MQLCNSKFLQFKTFISKHKTIWSAVTYDRVIHPTPQQYNHSMNTTSTWGTKEIKRKEMVQGKKKKKTKTTFESSRRPQNSIPSGSFLLCPKIPITKFLQFPSSSFFVPIFQSRTQWTDGTYLPPQSKTDGRWRRLAAASHLALLLLCRCFSSTTTSLLPAARRLLSMTQEPGCQHPRSTTSRRRRCPRGPSSSPSRPPPAPA
jgi:hypothetical protein